MNIVGLTGAAGAGKDTAASFVVNWLEERDYSVVRTSFAEILKVSAMKALGIKGAGTGDLVAFADLLKESGKITVATGDREHYSFSGREYLQWYGTEAHREVFGDAFWVDALFDRFSDGWLPDVLVITDARFDNEGAAITQRDGLLWRVVREDAPGATMTHASESGIDDGYVTLEINNNGTLEDLKNMVELVCEARL